MTIGSDPQSNIDSPQVALSCPQCGAVRNPLDAFCANCGFQFTMPVPAIPALGAAAVPSKAEPVGSKPGLTFDIDYPQSLSRWKIFVKWLLAIPHYIVLYFLYIGVGIVQLVAFVAILITGNFPRTLWNFVVFTLRWQASVTAYVLLQRDEYPPFGDGPYPLHLDLDYPDSLSRWKIFVKWLLVIPNVFVYGFVALAALVVVVFAFFAILITGKFPEGAFKFVTGAYRWNFRISAYTLLLTDSYPTFSLD